MPSEFPPFTRTEARRAIRETALGELLKGYRGGPNADVDALASTLVDLGQLARSESVAELDLSRRRQRLDRRYPRPDGLIDRWIGASTP